MDGLHISDSIHTPASTVYEMKKVLGEGRFGQVHLAQNKGTSEYVAVKKVPLDKIGVEHIILKKLCHVNIVRYYECYHTDFFEIILQYAGDMNLLRYVQYKDLTELEVRGIMLQVFSAVDYLHNRGVVHRDIKLENIMILHSAPILIDFGFATFWREGHCIETYCGSVHYAAPEILCGTPYAGPEVDVWSVAVVIYALIHKGFPFFGDTDEDLYSRILAGRTTFDKNISPALKHMLTTTFLFPATRRRIRYMQNSPWAKGMPDITTEERLNVGNTFTRNSTHEDISSKTRRNSRIVRSGTENTLSKKDGHHDENRGTDRDIDLETSKTKSPKNKFLGIFARKRSGSVAKR